MYVVLGRFRVHAYRSRTIIYEIGKYILKLTIYPSKLV